MTEKPAMSGWNSADQLKQALVLQAFDILVEDPHFMPVLLEQRAQETDAQRVFAIHLLGIIRPWNDKQDAHQRAPFDLPFSRNWFPRARKSSMAGWSS